MTDSPLLLQYTSILPSSSTTGRHPLIILLHGRGSDEEDLLGLAPALNPSFKIVSIRAPFPFDWGGYTWFAMNGSLQAEPASLQQSYSRLLHTLEQLAADPTIDPQQMYLMGFSMGTIMAYAIALTKPGLITGVIGQSGVLVESEFLEYQWNETSRSVFMITHGTEDAIIPVVYGQRSAERLRKAGFDVVYREYRMGHEISDESLHDVAQWLDAHLSLRREES